MKKVQAQIIWLAVYCLFVSAGADVVTNILRVENMTQMLNNMIVVSEDNGLDPDTADYSSSPDSQMMGFNGTGKRGLLYTTVQDVLGVSSIQAGTYTLTMQVGLSLVKPALPWRGMWDTISTGWLDRRTDAGFAGALFTELDLPEERVAYTMDSANDFNLMSGVDVDVESDSALDVLVSGATLADDTWYDVVYTWTVDETAAAALDGQTVYIGYGGACGEGTSLWLTNSEFTFEAIPEPATVGLFGIAALVVTFIRRAKG